ncbi:Transcription factor tau [Yarrowia sp. C11]|nr:Transcription factor tau [Yarrowia sp. E02]KAG5365354.1 Transcription factor tau [Yarrowia sp. C11]
MSSPDEIVDYLVENVALFGPGGVTLPQLWTLSYDKVPNLTPKLQEVIWKWLMNHPSMVVGVNGEDETDSVKSLDYKTLLETHVQDSIQVYADEDTQWRTLTGRPKKNNPIGAFPFEALCVVAAAREDGATAVQITKQTGQDARSIFGRVNALMEQGLVSRFPYYAGHNTNLIVYRSFVAANRRKLGITTGNAASSGAAGVDIADFRKRLVEATFNAHNRIRQYLDLRDEMGCGKTRRLKSYFARAVRQLEANGYVKRVYVYPDPRKDEKYYCLKFLKPYVNTTDMAGVDEDDDEEEEEEEEVEPEEEEKIMGSLDVMDDTEGIKMEDVGEPLQPEENSHIISFNRFYPLINQIFNLTQIRGSHGIPAMELCRLTAGISYTRMFSRYLEGFAERTTKNKTVKNKSDPELQYLNLIRGLDVNARTKYYRYVTEMDYRAFVGEAADPVWGNFRPLPSPGAKAAAKIYSCLGDMQHKLGSEIPGVVLTATVTLPDGSEHQFVTFRGYNVTPAAGVKISVQQGSGEGRPRGRPRKRPVEDESVPSDKPPPKKRGRKSKAEHERIRLEKEAAAALEAATQAADVEQQPESISSVAEAAVAAVLAETDPVEIAVRQEAEAEQAAEAGEPEVVRERLTSRGVVSFAAMERKSRIMKLLQANNGVLEGGKQLEIMFDASYSRSRNGKVDSKTLNRDINQLEDDGKVYRISVNVGKSRDSAIVRWMVVHASLPRDAPQVLDLKAQLIHRTKVASVPATHNPIRESLSGAFKLYHNPVANPRRSLGNEDKSPHRVQEPGSDGRWISDTRKVVPRKRKSLRASTLDSYEYHDQEPQQGTGQDTSSSYPHQQYQPQYSMDYAQEYSTQHPAYNSMNNQFSGLDDSMIEPEMIAQATLQSQPKRKSRKGDRLPSSDPLKILEHGIKRKSKLKIGATPSVSRSRMSGARRYDVEDNEKFFRLTIVARSFHGGTIPWQALAGPLRLPSYAAKAKWPRVRDIMGGAKVVPAAIEQFEDFFYEQYRKGTIAPISRLEEVNLEELAELWQQHEPELLPDTTATSFPLLESYEDNRKRYHMSVPLDYDESDPIDTVLSVQSMVKTEEALTNAPFLVKKTPVYEDPNPEAVQNAIAVIKSIIVSDDATYDEQAAKELLTPFGEQIVAEAVNQLDKHKVVNYIPRDMEKRNPGRNFAFSDKFWNAVSVRFSAGTEVFNEAKNFDKSMRECVNSSRGLVMSRLAPDGSMMAILDLVYHRIIDTVRVNDTIGSLIKGYVSRSVDKDKLDCDIIFRGFESLSIDEAAQDKEVPPPTEGLRIWKGMHGEVNEPIWKHLTSLFALSVALRPGVTVDLLAVGLTNILTHDEIRDVMQWLCDKQCLRKGECDGYWLMPGWYNVFA